MAYGDVFVRHSQRMRNETSALGLFALGLFGIANQRQRAEAEIKTALLTFLFLFGGIGTGGSQGFLINDALVNHPSFCCREGPFP